MIWIIISLVICVAMIINIFCDSWNDWLDKIMLSILTIFSSILMGFIVLLFASLITTCCAEVNYNMVSDTKIIALKDNQNVSGNFYIMGGYIDEDLYYYYATETEFGYKTEKVKANNAYIKYTDGETHIERYVGEFANDTSNLWGFPMYDDRYVIYCPDGTVTNEFIVDLE